MAIGDTKELERVLRALGNKRRLALVRFLKRNKEVNVTDLAESISLSFRSTSRHLAILFISGVVDRRQQSTEVYYFLAVKKHPVLELMLSLL